MAARKKSAKRKKPAAASAKKAAPKKKASSTSTGKGARRTGASPKLRVCPPKRRWAILPSRVRENGTP